jgi:hypothetical protein
MVVCLPVPRSWRTAPQARAATVNPAPCSRASTGGGQQDGAAAPGQCVPGYPAEQSEQVGQGEQPGGPADRPRRGEQLLPAGDDRAGQCLQRRQRYRPCLADDPAEQQEREHAGGGDGEQRQPGALARVAEHQADDDAGRAGDQVTVAAVGRAVPDDPDQGEREQREPVDQLVAAERDRVRRGARPGPPGGVDGTRQRRHVTRSRR